MEIVTFNFVIYFCRCCLALNDIKQEYKYLQNPLESIVKVTYNMKIFIWTVLLWNYICALAE